mmetsp:Transcript_70790/g.207404  ORF Transcript_70790/g.207404 Transcript_70790/m.207404 type:complete len:125 (-) Transcript_70790:1587-1961(-)
MRSAQGRLTLHLLLADGHRPQAMHVEECPCPLAQFRQHVSNGLPLGAAPGATGRPHPILHMPATAEGSAFWQVASCPVPSTQLRQQVVYGLPFASVPGATFSPQPTLQRPGPTFDASICPQSLS